MAGLSTISAVVMEGPIDRGEMLAIQLVENAVREDLRPIEQANAYRRLMEAKGWSTRQVARELSVDQAKVVRALAMLDLPGPVQEQVEQGAINPTTAYELSKVDDPDRQAELARRVVTEGLKTADVAEARKAPADRPKPRRIEIKVPGATVVVTIQEPDPTEEEVVAALQAAVKKYRKTRTRDQAA
jgi:ParB family chromosome partitioning protein